MACSRLGRCRVPGDGVGAVPSECQSGYKGGAGAGDVGGGAVVLFCKKGCVMRRVARWVVIGLVTGFMCFGLVVAVSSDRPRVKMVKVAWSNYPEFWRDYAN